MALGATVSHKPIVEQNSLLNCFKVQWQKDFFEMTKNKVMSDRSLGGQGGLEEAGAC